MARRAATPPTEPPRLSPDRAIRRLEQRIGELEALDCSALTSFDAPELETLRAMILTTLEDAFGPNSREYHRFGDAARFRQSRVIDMGGGGYGRGYRTQEIIQVREDCAAAKLKNVALLRTAIQVLQQRLEDGVDLTGLPAQPPASPPRERPSVVNIHNLGNIAGNFGVGNTSGAINQSGDSRLRLDCIDQLRKFEAELSKLPGLADFEARLADVEQELAKPASDQQRVAGVMTDIRNALVGASGNLIAQGAAALIQKAFGV